MIRKSLLIMMALFLVFGLALVLSTDKAMAQVKPGPEICNDKIDNDGDGLIDGDDPDCQPPVKGAICHNIGGPRDLGANCDMTGNCSFTTDAGTITVTPNHFLGIIIGFNQDSQGALAAHIAHGDGFIITTFDPPLHLASTGQNHQAANVECLAERIVPQPDEPGN